MADKKETNKPKPQEPQRPSQPGQPGTNPKPQEGEQPPGTPIGPGKGGGG